MCFYIYFITSVNTLAKGTAGGLPYCRLADKLLGITSSAGPPTSPLSLKQPGLLIMFGPEWLVEPE